MMATKHDHECNSLTQIATIIRDELFAPIHRRKTTVFICGAGMEKNNSVRSAIRRELTHKWYSYKYDVLLPEDLFGELLFGQHRCDLLHLETILADSVDVLVIIPESPGAIAELGAFSANDSLRPKIVCLQNAKRKKESSFINFGPIRHIRDLKQGKVICVDYNKIPSEMEKIRRAVSDVAASAQVVTRVDNLVQAATFLLLVIYLLEPAKKDDLEHLVSFASGGEPSTCLAATSGALGLLRKRRWVTLAPGGEIYILTEIGSTKLMELGRHGKSRSYFNIDVMDRIRADILTWMYRHKPLRKGA